MVVSPPISDTLANDALHRSNGAGAIINVVRDTVVIPELELGKVAVQMLLKMISTSVSAGARGGLPRFSCQSRCGIRLRFRVDAEQADIILSGRRAARS